MKEPFHAGIIVAVSLGAHLYYWRYANIRVSPCLGDTQAAVPKWRTTVRECKACLPDNGKRLTRTVLIFTESSDQLSKATDRVPGLLEEVVYVITETVRKTAMQIRWRGMYQRLLKVDPLKCILCGSQMRFTGLKRGYRLAELVLMHERLARQQVCGWEPQRGSCVHFTGNGAKNRHSYPVSISVILFNSRFRSYGAQGVLKKHPFHGAFLVFWGF